MCTEHRIRNGDVLPANRMQHLLSADCDDLRGEKENLERALEGIRNDYQAEMGRLEAENKQLREREH